MIYGLVRAGSTAHRGSITKHSSMANLEKGARGKPVPSSYSRRKVSTGKARVPPYLGD